MDSSVLCFDLDGMLLDREGKIHPADIGISGFAAKILVCANNWPGTGFSPENVPPQQFVSESGHTISDGFVKRGGYLFTG